jgi:aminopeptidase N
MFNKYIFPQLSAVFLLLWCIPYSVDAASVDTRNDSFYISHYAISLDLSNLSSKTISGNCKIKGISKTDKLDRLSLELYMLTVDSVIGNGKNIPYFYNDSLLIPHLSKLYNTNDSFEIVVYYHGQPVQTSWGGFYFDASGQYAYNLGVSLYGNPHNFGRIWFPCVDNFIDKATFSFFIKTKDTHKCYCNGLLQDSVTAAGNTLIWHWEMHQPIVPYLASVAVGNYQTLYSSFNSKTGKKPILIGVLPKDTTIAKSTFQHLNLVLAEYEKYYTPYAFDRVGFVGVNFGSGAMEHASNIALPNSVIEAGLAQESLWAHELSHHWWGDLVTCSTAADMWLNEGWASYNESLYQELLYGTAAYHAYARTNHYYALRYAHIVDNGDRALSPMPTEYTYGPTIYKKGADVARSLRGYLGDSLFFKGIQNYLHDYAFKSASSEDFKNALSKSTGVDLTDFFHDWVYGNGWPHFEISQAVADSAAHVWNVSFNTRTVNNFNLYRNTPLEITWYNTKWQPSVINLKPDGNNQYHCQIPFSAIFYALDINGKITDATTKEYRIIKAKGSNTYSESLLNLNVDSLKDSALVYVVQNWIGADRTQNTPKNIRLSGDRYWTIDGIFTPGFHATATIIYDGRTFSSPYSGGFLDNELLKGRSEDSIVLMYKPVTGGDWILLKDKTDYIKSMGGSHSDAFGNIKILNLKRGQYCMGAYDFRAAIPSDFKGDNGMELYPNPTANQLHIKFKEAKTVKSLQIYNLEGKRVKIFSSSAPRSIDFLITDLDLGIGTYILQVTTDGGMSSRKFVIEH